MANRNYSRSGKTLKIVSIAHSAFLDGSARLRYEPLADDPDLDVTLIIPDRWSESGHTFEAGKTLPRIPLQTMKVMLPELPKMNWYGHFYPGMRKMLQELSPDVLHLWEEPWSLVAAQAVYLCRGRGIPVVLETEQNILRTLPFPFQQLRSYCLSRIQMLVARQKEALAVSRACGYEGPAEIIEYVIDRSCFKPTSRDLARKTFQVDGFTIGYVGRFVPEKGLLTVLEALTSCDSRVKLVMMGRGSETPELNRYIQSNGLADRVRILDPQPQEGVALFMNSLDALVLMSKTTRTWKEQFGRVIIEAQACGVPVIGSSSGAIPSVVGEGGWIVEESNSKMLAALLDSVLRDPQALQQTAEKARNNVARFCPEVAANNLRRAWLGAIRQLEVQQHPSVGESTETA